MAAAIFIAGATGNQGGTTIKELLRLNKDTTIHALVRNPDSAASQDLVALSPNIKLFKGDFDDVASIQAAMAGCKGAFLNVTPVFTDPTAEAQHANNLIAVCSSTASLKRIVYSSSGAMQHPLDSKLWTEYVPNNPNTFMSYYMKSKRACEDAVTGTSTSDLTDGWCIIRGNTFFTNFLKPFSKFMYPNLDVDQTITTALKPDLQFSYLDPADLGMFAARALLSDQQQWIAKYKGKIVPMGKQNLTLQQVIDSMNKALSGAGVEKQIRLVYIPEDEAKKRAAEGDMIIESQLFGQAYPHVLLAEEAKAAGVDVDGMTGLDDFFQQEKEKVIGAVGGP